MLIPSKKIILWLKKTELSVDRIRIGKSVLEKNGWIVRDRFSIDVAGKELEAETTFSLSEDGFDKAHELVMEENQQDILEQQNKISYRTMVVYVMLVAAVSIQAFATASNVGADTKVGVGAIVVLIMLGLVIISVWDIEI